MTGVGSGVSDRFLTNWDFYAGKGQAKGIAEYQQGTISCFLAKVFGKTMEVTEKTTDGKTHVHVLNTNSVKKFLDRNGLDPSKAKGPVGLTELLITHVKNQLKNVPKADQLAIVTKQMAHNDVVGKREDVYKFLLAVQQGAGIKFDDTAMKKWFPKDASHDEVITVKSEEFDKLVNTSKPSGAPLRHFTGEDKVFIDNIREHVAKHSNKPLQAEAPDVPSDDLSVSPPRTPSAPPTPPKLERASLEKAKYKEVLPTMKKDEDFKKYFAKDDQVVDTYNALKEGALSRLTSPHIAFAMVFRLIDANHEKKDLGAVKMLLDGIKKLPPEDRKMIAEAARNEGFRDLAHKLLTSREKGGEAFLSAREIAEKLRALAQ